MPYRVVGWNFLLHFWHVLAVSQDTFLACWVLLFYGTKTPTQGPTAHSRLCGPVEGPVEVFTDY